MNTPVFQLGKPYLQRCPTSRGDFRNLQYRGAPPLRQREREREGDGGSKGQNTQGARH